MDKIDFGFKGDVSSIAHEKNWFCWKHLFWNLNPYLCCLKAPFIFVLDMYAKKCNVYFSDKGLPYEKKPYSQKAMSCHHGVDGRFAAKQKRNSKYCSGSKFLLLTGKLQISPVVYIIIV